MGIFSAPRWDEDSVGSKVVDEKTSAQKKSIKRKKKQVAKKNGSPANELSADGTRIKSGSGKQTKKNGSPANELSAESTSIKPGSGKQPKKNKKNIFKVSKKVSMDSLIDQEAATSSPSEVVSKRQKRRLNLKMKKLLKSKQNGSSKSNSSTQARIPSKVGKNVGGNSDRVQSKIEKLLEIRKKKKKANSSKKNSQASPTASLANQSSPLKSQETQAEKRLRLKLKRKERRLKRKESLAKQRELEQAKNSNEIVLSKKNKRKMHKIAKRASENNLKQLVQTDENGLGTSNPSFDTSLSDLSTPQTSNGAQIEKKKKRKKKKIGSGDSVDGNLVSTSGKFSVISNDKSSKNMVSVTSSDSIADKSQRKKVVIAKLLHESNISDANTLHDLKKKRIQDRIGSDNGTGSPKQKKKPMLLREKMTEQLKSSRFRWLNEQLYTSNSWEAMKYFKEDPEAFNAYHSGYRNQVAQWPVNPLDVIIESISSLSKGIVVADFGCGDARLAATLPHLKVHSLDLIASKPGVVACDMAHTPLLMESVDVAVFCLSLMGTNLNDFILEANRVLKNGGMLLIAEVESRFEDVDNFTSAMVHFGFQLKKKDLSNQMFIFMDFKKTRKVSKTGKLPALTLEPCVYKKR